MDLLSPVPAETFDKARRFWAEPQGKGAASVPAWLVRESACRAWNLLRLLAGRPPDCPPVPGSAQCPGRTTCLDLEMSTACCGVQ